MGLCGLWQVHILGGSSRSKNFLRQRWSKHWLVIRLSLWMDFRKVASLFAVFRVEYLLSVILQQCLNILGVILSVKNDSGLVCKENGNRLPARERATQEYPSGSVEAAGSAWSAYVYVA